MRFAMPWILAAVFGTLSASRERGRDAHDPEVRLGADVQARRVEQPGNGLAFTAPPGYEIKRTGELIMLAPRTVDARTPCAYGIAGSFPGSGNLERDAMTALTGAVMTGWQRLDDRHAAMRGNSSSGWPYVWVRAAFSQTPPGGQRQAVNAMAMVLPAGPGRVHLVWGMGSIAQCLLDDGPFEQLFHSLRPAGWTSDGGAALMLATRGAWRFTAGSGAGLQQFAFMENGRYSRDVGSRAQVGAMERTSATATDGAFRIENGELTLVPDHRPQSPDRYLIRPYEEWSSSGWRRSLTLTDARSTPPLVTQYYQITP